MEPTEHALLLLALIERRANVTVTASKDPR